MEGMREFELKMFVYNVPRCDPESTYTLYLEGTRLFPKEANKISEEEWAESREKGTKVQIISVNFTQYLYRFQALACRELTKMQMGVENGQ